MSSSHRSGWSDEELISFNDLRFSGNGNRSQANTSRSNEAPRRSRSNAPTEPTSHRAAQPRRSATTSRSVPASAPRSTATPPERREINLRSLFPGSKKRMQTFQELRHEMMVPVDDASIGVFSRKGGVGKTTVTAYLGLMLSRVRRGPVVAVDGDPEAGSLGWMLAPEGRATLEALAGARRTPQTFDELMPYITETPDGLDLILGDTMETLPVDADGLESALGSLRNNYDVSLFDTGSGVTHTVGRTLINNSRVLLLVMNPNVESVRSAERSLAWLDERHDATHPPAEVIAVINGVTANMRESELEEIEDLFLDRCVDVVRIPWDEHLAGGSASASVSMLARSTQLAFMELAAVTMGILARPEGSRLRSGRHVSQ